MHGEAATTIILIKISLNGGLGSNDTSRLRCASPYPPCPPRNVPRRRHPPKSTIPTNGMLMSTLAQTATSARDAGMTKEERFVIFASSLGTVFEWYDFYLYAILAPFFAALFFPPGNETAALLSAFATYAAGFLVRPFGALVFGRIGDLVGPQIHLPGYHRGDGLLDLRRRPSAYLRNIGWVAPVLLVSLRLLQGLALGGEYGGAATYVAEHSRAARARLRTRLDTDDGDRGPVSGAHRDLLCRYHVGWPRISPTGVGGSHSWCRPHAPGLLGLYPAQAQ